MQPFVSNLDDQAVKELVILPKGLRITFLAEKANRGRNLIFRDAEMGKTRLNPARVAPLLARRAGLADQMTAPNQGYRREKPAIPLIVLIVSIILQGAGQVVNCQPVRGVIFWFFILLPRAYTLKTAAPDVSNVGKLAGGLFVYAVSLLDAYEHARIRTTIQTHRKARPKAPPFAEVRNRSVFDGPSNCPSHALSSGRNEGRGPRLPAGVSDLRPAARFPAWCQWRHASHRPAQGR